MNSNYLYVTEVDSPQLSAVQFNDLTMVQKWHIQEKPYIEWWNFIFFWAPDMLLDTLKMLRSGSELQLCQPCHQERKPIFCSVAKQGHSAG